MINVPNLFPTLVSSRRIALIGEIPGKPSGKDKAVERPFSGSAGWELDNLLKPSGHSRSCCFVGNVSQYQPADNKVSSLAWSDPEIQTGIAQLRNDLAKWKPNICVLFGNLPLKLARAPDTDHPLVNKRFKYKIDDWRGSLFLSTEGPLQGLKCIATYHPTALFAAYANRPYVQFDLQRAVWESVSPTLVLPQRTIDLDLSAQQIIAKLREIRERKLSCSIDIEGGIGTMSCISFATSKNYAFIIPFFRRDYSPCFIDSEAIAIWRELALTLEDESVPKILQNSLYDRFVNEYSYFIRISGVNHDTMLKHWERFCEFEKNLALQTSIYTREPYYKGDRKSQDDRAFYSYCCLDSLVTYEINEVLETKLNGTSLDHYQLNIALLEPLLFMELHGMPYDSERSTARRETLRQEQFEKQARLNAMTGRALKWISKAELLNASLIMSRKARSYASFDDIATMPLKAYQSEAMRLLALVSAPYPNLATIGEIEDLVEVSLNVDSKALQSFLYDELHLPTQYKLDKDKIPHVTADYEAIINLKRELTDADPNDYRLEILTLISDIRSLKTRISNLDMSTDNDGHIRCGYNVVGSVTGRLTCYESPTGSGANLQTITEDDRDCFPAPSGCWIAQMDLRGADGWTVAAYAAMLNDRTMLDDYLYGLKPAQILCLMLRGISVDYYDRAALLEACKAVRKEDWDYFAMKRVQHGASYLEGGKTISRNIFKDSEGRFYLNEAECTKLRDKFFFDRYPGIRRWHDWTSRQLSNSSRLVAASGQVRQFFGRKEEILTKAVAHEPQANTTYATNLALHKLWTDPDNRVSASSLAANPYADRVRAQDFYLRIQPLHQVHDALLVAFRKEGTEWAKQRIRTYFNNPITIAGQRIVIPFDGSYGESWGCLKEGKI